MFQQLLYSLLPFFAFRQRTQISSDALLELVPELHFVKVKHASAGQQRPSIGSAPLLLTASSREGVQIIQPANYSFGC
ncbi:hypothetical protein [Paenibacillus sp. FSL R7-0179]|uniref:hypothetical protein n=1 Tax=Paenibacillus sp. FSL R7-0179 TaxID=2921672 RepID=UPI0030F54A80